MFCGSTATEQFLARDGVPVHQNVLFETAEEARGIARGRLRMVVCGSCGFVFNSAFDPSRIVYGRGYDNDQTFSPLFNDYVESLVDRLARDPGIDDRTIAEVGCGNGYFLQRVIAKSAGSRGVGYDPSYTGALTTADGRIEFVQSTFTSDTARPAPDLIICRHVIEHLPDPAGFVSELRSHVAEGATIVFETPCVEWILRHGVIWDFFYEHCSLFSAASLARVVQRSGFGAARVSHVFSGQYLWLTARAGASIAPDPPAADLVVECRRFATHERDTRARWEECVRSAQSRGGVAVWGAGAKGSTFVNLIDPDRRDVMCLVDVNPRKQGRFVAGTGHPVVPPETLASRGVSTVIIMNPNYASEIQSAAGASSARLEYVTP